MSFSTLNLGDPLLRAIKEKGYINPTPIQEQTIPHLLQGKDVLACAQTGTGKTAAFCIPILQHLSSRKSANRPRALILTPTRELAIQVSDNLKLYGKYLQVKSALVFGGVSQGNQVQEIRNGADVIVATPGRLLDLINQNIVRLHHLEILVLDEADRMLDMGFIRDIRKIIQLLPANRQNVFLSATMPESVRTLASTIVKDPVRITIEHAPASAMINQGVYFVSRESKRKLLKHIIVEQQMRNVLVFTRTKFGADKIARDLKKSGISAEAFHGNKSQTARQRTLSNFKKNATRVLVATDIAARGIDIIDLPYVINYELPETVETYTHRIGRTGRAGASGTAFSLCDQMEKSQLKNISRSTSVKLQVMDHPFS